MTAVPRHSRQYEQIFLLDKVAGRAGKYSDLKAELVNSKVKLHASLSHAKQDSLWISFDRSLTEELLRSWHWPRKSLGGAFVMHALDAHSIPALLNCFRRLAFVTGNNVLKADEFVEALLSEKRADLILGGNLDRETKTITLWRGNMESITVPFSAFSISGNGIKPNWDKFQVTDFGQTIQFGEYEAATDAVLYEFDPEYRRRALLQRRESEQTIGASVRRLRKQRGLRQQDFAPELDEKTIARIEQNKIKNIRATTLNALARHLRVKPGDLATY